MKINGNLVFNTDASGEIQNAILERKAAAPTFNSAEAGRLYYNTTDGLYYFNDAEAWVPFATGGNAAALQTEVDNIEATLGAGINGNGTIGTFSADVTAIVGSTPTSWTQVINALASYADANNTLAELDDVTLGSLAQGQVLYYNATASAWVNGAPGATSGVQGYDAGLASLAALTGPGFVTVDASGDVVSARTFVMPAEGLSMTAADGSGAPTISLTNDLAAVEGLTGTGIAVRTAADTWATRTVTGGTTGTIIVDNGSGVSGDPTLNMQTLTIATDAGTFRKFEYDTYGRVTSIAAVTTADITGLVDATYVNVSGDTMTGNLNMGGTYTVTGLAAPTNASDAVTKNYVDNAVAGMTWEAPVEGMAADAAALPATPAAGDRYYQADITSIVTYDGSAWVAEALVDGAAFFNSATDTGYVYNGTAAVPFTGGGALTAGNGLLMTGNQIDVNFGAGVTMLPSDEVGLHIRDYTGSALGFHNGTGRVATEAAAVSGDTLALFLDGVSLAQSATGLKVAAGGVTEVEINSSALDANAGITGGSGTKLALNVNATHLEVSGNVLTIADDGVTTVKILDGNVTNAKLQNSTVSLTDGTTTDAVALGETITFTGSNGLTATVSANAVDVELTGSLDNLSDVAISSAVQGHTLVNDGTNFVNQAVYFLYQAGAAATSHAITHNLGQKYCNVTVVDGADEVVIPQSITFNTANQLTVTFTSALACKVVIMGVQTEALPVE